MRTTSLLFLSGAFASLSSAALAADSLMTPVPMDQWQINLGGTFTAQPAFEGASGVRPGFSPNISISRSGTTPQFQAPEDGVSLNLLQSGPLKFGAAFGLDMGRSSQDSPHLTGLHNVPWTINSGVFAEYWPISDRFRTRLEVLHGFRGADGFIANLSADWVEQFGALTLSGGPRLTLADHNQMKSRFGVTAADSLASGYAAYDPHAGVKSVGFGLAQSYKLSPGWTGTLYQHYDRLTGSAANSPFGLNRNQFSVGAGVTYSFGLGSKP